MKSLWLYGCLLSILMCSMIGCNQGNQKRIPSLKETYKKDDKKPFGGYVAFERLGSIFNDREIWINNQPLDEVLPSFSGHTGKIQYSLYVLITKNLLLNDAEVVALIKYISEGNDVFISADYIDNKLLENIFATVNRKAEIEVEKERRMKETFVSIYYGEEMPEIKYSYYYYPFYNSIESYEKDFTRILGVNERKQPNYAVFFLNKGRIYIHTAPRIFSNYFLLTGDNYKYFENVISFLRLNPKDIFWDEYYKNASSKKRGSNKNKDDSFSSTKVINNNPSLLWAFWLAISGMLLFILFNSKRKQRIIREKMPPANATVSFIETVGSLYFQHKDNRKIADKKIMHFYEHVRNKYYITSPVNDPNFINSLSGKTGVPVSEVEILFSLVHYIQSQDSISDEQLLELNSKIDHFNKITS